MARSIALALVVAAALAAAVAATTPPDCENTTGRNTYNTEACMCGDSECEANQSCNLDGETGSCGTPDCTESQVAAVDCICHAGSGNAECEPGHTCENVGGESTCGDGEAPAGCTKNPATIEFDVAGYDGEDADLQTALEEYFEAIEWDVTSVTVVDMHVTVKADLCADTLEDFTGDTADAVLTQLLNQALSLSGEDEVTVTGTSASFDEEGSGSGASSAAVSALAVAVAAAAAASL
uniref:EGF-like domain-containing protein n=1 Tax=Bicosoecida sp. CB-2014 TaxID=1486930 RepID=A0A7S1CI21_9STRA|mmetsp:Transcript_27627/g.95531  ORF Transcript_27627/g.95531 Transcript_27627/m.95531 type:complete len:237 (+) Transcript_27627:69-779(+)